MAVAAGSVYSVAVESNGVVIAWGNNSLGQTKVPAGLSNVVAIAAGQNFSLALQANGKWSPGVSIGSGQTDVPAGLANVVAIAAGGLFGLALQGNGTWWWPGATIIRDRRVRRRVLQQRRLYRGGPKLQHCVAAVIRSWLPGATTPMDKPIRPQGRVIWQR